MSLLRPVIWAGMIAALVIALQPLSPGPDAKPASTLTELRLDDLKKPAIAPKDDLETTVVADDEPAGVFLGGNGKAARVSSTAGSQDGRAGQEQQTRVAAVEIPQEAGIVEVFAPIMRAESGRFTIQVASTGTWVEADEMMVKLSKRYNLRDEFFVYRSQAGGKLLFPVLYGNFVSSSQAEAAIADLPGHLRAGQPFVRKFGTVQRMLAEVSG